MYILYQRYNIAEIVLRNKDKATYCVRSSYFSFLLNNVKSEKISKKKQMNAKNTFAV